MRLKRFGYGCQSKLCFQSGFLLINAYEPNDVTNDVKTDVTTDVTTEVTHVVSIAFGVV